MADTKDTNIKQPGKTGQTMKHEQAKAEVSGQKSRQDERDKLDQQRHQQREDKSPFGSSSYQPTSQVGEPGRARNELDQEKKKKEPAGEQR